jgi:hypothetical protein
MGETPRRNAMPGKTGPGQGAPVATGALQRENYRMNVQAEHYCCSAADAPGRLRFCTRRVHVWTDGHQ